jgi:hypothetical protein
MANNPKLDLLYGFPISFESLKEQYRNFEPIFEMDRGSLEAFFEQLLKQTTLEDLEGEINDPVNIDVKEMLRQRFFYQSAVCFYRSLQLFLAYLCLDRHFFPTWGEVTGYYSRFYFNKALINLLQAGWICIKRLKGRKPFFVYNNGQDIIVRKMRWPGPHQSWWEIFLKLNSLPEYAVSNEEMEALARHDLSPEARNRLNYENEFGVGFPELEWFDTSSILQQYPQSAYFRLSRRDVDITSIEGYFEGRDPAECDIGDYYDDKATLLVNCPLIYLELLKALEIKQDFITSAKIAELIDLHIKGLYPRLTEGLINKINQIT